MTIDPRLRRIIAAQPYPLLFATISGAHLYGFPSPDSDCDLRGAHVLPLEKVVGLDVRDETIEQSFVEESACRAEAQSNIDSASAGELRRDSLHPDVIGGGRRLEMDIVSHDVRKFFGLLLKKNGYVLEQLFSPLIVHTTPEHAELKAICCPNRFDTSPPAPLPDRGGEGRRTGVITKHHSHHYFGFAETQWKLFEKERPRRVKPLLYVYRVLLTGIHLMRTGEVEANLVTLNKKFNLSYIDDLIARKLAGPENIAVGHLLDSELTFHESEYQRLRGELQKVHENSSLPELPSDETRTALNDLLIRIRLSHRRTILNE
jgi:predicted nucleotidyltransferase